MLLLLGPFNRGSGFEIDGHAAGAGDYKKPHSRLIAASSPWPAEFGRVVKGYGHDWE